MLVGGLAKGITAERAVWFHFSGSVGRLEAAREGSRASAMSPGQHSGRISPVRSGLIITFGFAGRAPCVTFPRRRGTADDSRSACRGDARRQRRDRPYGQTELIASAVRAA